MHQLNIISEENGWERPVTESWTSKKEKENNKMTTSDALLRKISQILDDGERQMGCSLARAD